MKTRIECSGMINALVNYRMRMVHQGNDQIVHIIAFSSLPSLCISQYIEFNQEESQIACFHDVNLYNRDTILYRGTRSQSYEESHRF